MLRRILMTLSVSALTACAHAPPIDAPQSAAVGPEQVSDRSQELLSRLVGRWVLSGDIAGESTVHDVDATWALQRNYVRIEEISRERGDDGLAAYEATIFIGWLESADHYVCLWLDNTEVASGEVTCVAMPSEDALPLEFRDAQGALIFTNTFTYNRAADSWEWRMDNIRDGQPATFGLVTLRRR